MKSEQWIQETLLTAPQEVFAYLETDEPDMAELSWAGEYLGQLAETSLEETALQILERLLQHSRSFVREGAAMGLSQFENPRAQELLRARMEIETSPGMQETLTQYLQD